MSWGLVAVAGATLVGGVMSANAQKKAGQQAANAQETAALAGVDEQRRQFDALQQLLSPFVNAGTSALNGQLDLAGRNGDDAQAAAIQALQRSPQFTSALALGENRLLANASATGSVRGGNTQAALAQFSPQLLAASINDQYARLGGLTTLGANAAAGVGSAGMQTGDAVTRLLAQQGSARAGAAMSQGRSNVGYANAISSAFGAYAGFGGTFGGGLTIDPNGYGITPANIFNPAVRGGI